MGLGLGDIGWQKGHMADFDSIRCANMLSQCNEI